MDAFEIAKTVVLGLAAFVLWSVRGAFFGGRKASEFEQRVQALEKDLVQFKEELTRYYDTIAARIDRASAKQSQVESLTMTKILALELKIQELITTLCMARAAIEKDHARFDGDIKRLTEKKRNGV